MLIGLEKGKKAENVQEMLQNEQSLGSYGLALFRSLCNKWQLSRKNKFDKLSGIFPALVFVAF